MIGTIDKQMHLAFQPVQAQQVIFLTSFCGLADLYYRGWYKIFRKDIGMFRAVFLPEVINLSLQL